MDYLFQSFQQALYLLSHPEKELLGTVFRSFLFSATATFLAALGGIFLALILNLSEFKLKKLVVALLNTWMALPAVTVGLLVYILLSRRGPCGSFGLLFSPYAIIIAQTILATPLIAALSFSALSSVASEFSETAQALGANKFQVATVLLREAKLSLLVAVLTGFSRLLGETGMTLMVGGNIKGSTRVMTTAIALETMKGNFETGISLGIVLVISALILNIILQLFPRYIQWK